jgi:hypothetical protein
VIQTESQAMLNTVTEYVFQDVFRKWQKRWEHVDTHGRGLLREFWYSVGPKVISDQMAAPRPEIMDGSSSQSHFVTIQIIFLLSKSCGSKLIWTRIHAYSNKSKKGTSSLYNSNIIWTFQRLDSVSVFTFFYRVSLRSFVLKKWGGTDMFWRL